MYPHFIELHAEDNGERMMFSIDHIRKFYEPDNKKGTPIYTDDGFDWCVKESYDEVKHLIEDVGCSINRADPRIDTHSSLTMNQIMRILGEPVWNSNLNQWALVHYYNPDNDTIQLMNPGGKIYIMTEEEMIRFPLYRMRE